MSEPAAPDRPNDVNAHRDLRGWPSWKTRDTGWLLTALGTVMTIAVYLQPSLVTGGFRSRLGGLLLLMAATLALSVIIFLIECSLNGLKKVRAFDAVADRVQRAEQERDAARGALLQYTSANTPYEVDRVVLHQNQYYVAVRRKPGAALPVGTVFAVIDATNGSIMGKFRATEVRKSEYYAVADGDIDALWAGYLRAVGKAVCSPPPNSVAFVFPEQDQEK